MKINKLLLATLCPGIILASSDGSTEKGFVSPPQDRQFPPAPPRTVSSAESFNGCCCCPVTPLSRTETKKPSTPPVVITKLKH